MYVLALHTSILEVRRQLAFGQGNHFLGVSREEIRLNIRHSNDEVQYETCIIVKSS